MPRTKGSKNRPKTNITKDYASQITEKQESIVSLTAEIAAIAANIDTLKADLKEKKTALKKAAEEAKKAEAMTGYRVRSSPETVACMKMLCKKCWEMMKRQYHHFFALWKSGNIVILLRSIFPTLQ